MKPNKRVQEQWQAHKVGVIVVLVLLIMSGTMAWLLFGDGGPSPDTSQGGTSYGPRIESWSLHQNGTVVCDNRDPCMRDQLQEASTRGDCTWTGRAWLSLGRNPFFLHSIETEGYAVLQQTRIATVTASFDFDIGTVWWRAVGEHPTVSLTMPCDVKVVTLSFNVQGETLGGRNVSQGGATDIEIHREPWEYPPQ